MSLRCPVCRADNGLDPACRRCKADLAFVVQVERQRLGALAAARRHLAADQPAECLAAAAQAHSWRADADSARLLALGHLLAGQFPLALRWFSRGRRG